MPQNYDSVLARDLLDRINESLLLPESSKIIVIGIDGPTAAGKTILADSLADKITTTMHRPCRVFRLDWTLIRREARARDLNLFTGKNEQFLFEGELHMRLALVQEFLEEIRLFNEQLEIVGSVENKTISLEKLYSREDGGNLTGQEEFLLMKGMVVIVEGHYTLRTQLNQLIDNNILLLANPAELLRRKIDRVKNYRGIADAEKYFRLVDMPSFSHHLLRFRSNASVVIDNTNYQHPVFENLEYINQWLRPHNLSSQHNIENQVVLSYPHLVDRVLSNSLMVTTDLKLAFCSVLELIEEWDRHVGSYFRTNIENIDGDLTLLGRRLVSSLNVEHSDTPYEFKIKNSNTFYNVYNRSLPIAIGISVEGEQNLKILANVFDHFLRIQTSWAGGYNCFHIIRELGEITSNDVQQLPNNTPTWIVEDRTPDHLNIKYCESPIRIITPTQFTIPSFLKDLEIEEIFSGLEEENITASEALVELSEKGGVWIQRFATFSELNFIQNIIIDSGGSALKAGNYLIVVWSNHQKLNLQFNSFSNAWNNRLLYRENEIEDEESLDQVIEEDRQNLIRIVEENLPDFAVLDSYLHCFSIGDSSRTWERIITQISMMLLSPSRLLRKKTVQFIQKYFPDLDLETSKLWDNLPPGAQTHITLDTLVSISPSILAEVYLWLSIRDKNEAILGANIYDIRKRSTDCLAYLEASSAKDTAIVLQGSLNALGQIEKQNGSITHGYLKSDKGALDLVESALSAARDMVLVTGKTPPLFGIGLDHVDSVNDKPKGRAKRFLQQAMDSELVTHYVLDGSALFSAKSNSRAEMEESFQAISKFSVDLLDKNTNSYIYDKEICSGELNYIGSSKKALIPTPENMEHFSITFQENLRDAGLGALNTRPTLFIGNLGTTHHGYDSGEIKVEISRNWRDRLKRNNFVSPVLHGTTGSHPHVLSRATTGCHKINVAGNLLHTLVNALPVRLQSIIQTGDKEPKQMIPEIREDMNHMSSAEQARLVDSLRAHCHSILDNINSPQLTPLDLKYFHYKNYKFSPNQAETICNSLIKQAKQLSETEDKKPADPACAYEFSASMIEVPFGKEYNELTQLLWEEGVRRFHIDVGDGKFISRKVSGLEKAHYIRQTFPEAILHCHLMVDNPNYTSDGSPSFIEQYIGAGCNGIAIHEKSFINKEDFYFACKHIRELGARAGLIVETSATLDASLEQLLLKTELDWVVVMGVPVGFGGQIFDMSSLKRISWLHNFAITHNKPVLIEVDGGLTLENISLSKKSGAQIFSGWSIIKSDSTNIVRQKLQQLKKAIT